MQQMPACALFCSRRPRFNNIIYLELLSLVLVVLQYGLEVTLKFLLVVLFRIPRVDFIIVNQFELKRIWWYGQNNQINRWYCFNSHLMVCIDV